MDENTFRGVVARNLTYFRKQNNMTQAELAEKIHYSDKSVSKWERGDGLPDAYVLMLIAELFNIDIDTLLREDLPEAPPIKPGKKRVIIPTMAVALVWLAASVVFLALRIITPSFDKAWMVFLLAIPASCIVTVVFSKLWWNLLVLCISVSALIWSAAVSIYIFVPFERISPIFVIAGIVQLLTILWFLLKHNPPRGK